MEMCNRRRVSQKDKDFFWSLVKTHKDNIVKDPMVATDAPKEICMIAIKEPRSTKGDSYDCNQRAPIVSLLVL